MSKTLKANTDLDSLIERIGVGPDEELRESHRRENYLRKFSALMSMDPNVKLSFNEQIAAVELQNEDPHILIPTQKYEQPLTDFQRKAYDLLIQETLTLHEIGHILYSDWPSFENLKDELDEGWHPSFKFIWNAIEDGCIEAQLRREFNSENELKILNANMAEQNEFGHKNKDLETGEGQTVYTMLQAMIVGILNTGNYDSGHLDKIVDPDDDTHRLAEPKDQPLFNEFVPVIEEYVDKAHNEPNAEKRNKICYDFFLKAKEYLEKADVSGRKDMQAKGNFAPMEGKPDDAHEGIGEARMDMDEAAPSSGGEDQQEGNRAMSEPAGTSSDIQENMEREIRQEAESLEGGEALIDEIENFHEMMKGASPGDTNMELLIPENEEPRPEIWQKANNLRKQLRTILRNRLNWHKDKREVRNRRRGQLDTKNMVRASRGDPRIFKQFKEGQEKDYSCIIVQDRSGSMSGQETDDAEVSVGAFSMALEDLGVDTMVLDFVGGKTRLAKPFGTSSRTVKGVLSSGRSGGGTPLRDATELARQRVKHGAGTHPFIIVVTDGKAANPSAYEKEIQKCNFPVIAIYLRPDLSYADGFNVRDVASEMSHFNAHCIVTSDSNLSSALYQVGSNFMV